MLRAGEWLPQALKETTAQLREAADLFRRAADNGVADASYQLGRLYQQGLGIPLDPVAAFENFLAAANGSMVHPNAGEPDAGFTFFVWSTGRLLAVSTSDVDGDGRCSSWSVVFCEVLVYNSGSYSVYNSCSYYTCVFPPALTKRKVLLSRRFSTLNVLQPMQRFGDGNILVRVRAQLPRNCPPLPLGQEILNKNESQVD